MDNLIDARGLACPEPVICTKKALDNLKTGIITTIVDNEVAKDNVLRLAKSLEYPVEVEKKDENFYIKIKKEMNFVEELDTSDEFVILITSEFLGRGNDELGMILTRSLFFTLTETTPLPRTIIFLNSGIKLTCEGSSVLGEIIALEKKGVEILSCGTCLDYYKLKDKLCVGSISNMYSIVEKLIKYRTINL